MTLNQKHAPRMARWLALALCAAMVCALAACGGNQSSSSLSQAGAGAILPGGGTVEAPQPAGSGTPAEACAQLGEALDYCLGWGPGSAGSSLNSVLAASTLLNWAQQSDAQALPQVQVAAAYIEWYGSLDEQGRQNFDESWPLVCDSAQQLLQDPAGMADLMENAGLPDDAVQNCTAENWQALYKAIQSAR